jgi:hypothetical protein
MRGARRDLFAEFFDAIEATGEYCGFFLGRLRPGMPEPEWFFFRHQEYDGLGALAHQLRTHDGIEVRIPSGAEPPSRWALVVAACRLLADALRGRRSLIWRSMNPSWAPQEEASVRPTAVAWSLFTEEETARLREAARRRGISFNAWLLWSLKEAVLPALSGRGTLDWHLPVNMRGALPADRDTANQALSLEVSFAPEATPAAVDDAIRVERRRLRIWWIAIVMAWLGRWMSGKRFRKLIQQTVEQQAWTGSFSNLGNIVPTAELADGGEWWLALNPVVRTGPVGMACVTWRGRLGVTLQLHPVLASDPSVAHAWLAAWRRVAEGR